MGAVLGLFKKDPRVDVLFEPSDKVWISYYADGVLDKHYKPWKFRHFEIRPDLTLIYAIDKNTTDNLLRKKTVFHISKFHLSLIPFDFQSDEFYIGDRICFKAECRRDKEDGVITNFRCLLSRVELIELLDVIKTHSKDNNIDIFRIELDKEIESRSKADLGNLSNNNSKSFHFMQQKRVTGMSSDAMKHLDNKEKVALYDKIVGRRGAFVWLPVAFSNDLVHGSWWYLFGSFFFLIVSIVVYDSTVHDTLGQDDSILTLLEFRIEWILLIISGLSFTLGSFAFMRACTDPPMKPLLPDWKHFLVDELLGAWFFFLGVVPAIPYCIVYWVGTKEILWIGLTVASFFALVVTYFFVLACYPSKTGHAGRSTHCLEYMIRIVGKRQFVMRNFSTDWLVCVWFIYWGTLFFTVVTFAYMLYSIHEGENHVLTFVNVTGFVDTFFFLIGAAYFVAGSFSEGSNEERLGRVQDDVMDESTHNTGQTTSSYPTGFTVVSGDSSPPSSVKHYGQPNDNTINPMTAHM